MTKAKKLRRLLEGDSLVRLVGAHDGEGAYATEATGFDGVWASGLEISAAHRLPDASILTMTEYLNAADVINNATDLPVLADCDTGFGDVNNVIHMVREYGRRGIAGVCIEDKRFPKNNSFLAGRQHLASVEEFTDKIRAAKDAQPDPDMVLVARIEALITGEKLSSAVARALAYKQAGADAVLIHSKEKTPWQIQEFMRQFQDPTPVAVVPTTYPQVTEALLTSLGVRLVIYANVNLRVSLRSNLNALGRLKSAGTLAAVSGDMVSMEEVYRMQGTARWRGL